ncbi:MAG: hypothetical protein ACXABO_16780 [Promethearchaeota archaeon]
MNFQKQFDGWLLDVSTYGNGVVLWVKTIKEQKVIRILHDFHPEFFAVPKRHTGKDFKRLKQILRSHQDIKDVRICEKYVKLQYLKKQLKKLMKSVFSLCIIPIFQLLRCISM